MHTNNKRNAYITHVQQSVENAIKGKSHLGTDILSIPGMSSPLVRHFLNNMCSLPETHYFEIGCWQGSTLIAALYGNKSSVVDAVAIDDGSLHPDSSIQANFLHNVSGYLQGYPVRFFEDDCFAVQPHKIFKQPVTAYFYDGHHGPASHEKAFTYFNDIFDDTFIAIIDDWNWPRVRKGTLDAFSKLNYTIEYQQEFFTTGNDSNDWWNGLCIAVIKR